jgi:SPP1 gp7 family putative phage head morphogenesis protein
MENFDALLENADWTKQSWDLPPYKSPEFLALGFDPKEFRKLPVYKNAVKAGLIKNDKWTGLAAPKIGDVLTAKIAPGAALLRKVDRKHGRALEGIPFDRSKVRKAIQSMTKHVAAFFDKVKPELIKQVTEAYGKLHKIDDADLDEIDEVMSVVDFSTFNLLPKTVQSDLEDVFSDAGEETLKSIGVAVNASKVPDLELAPKAFDQVNSLAVEYAQDRSAEMVGMKYVKGKLVPNPDAKWQITEETRDGIRSAVTEAVVGDLPVTKLADTLSAAYGFSSDRAEMIARTEMRMANGSGALAGYQASGVIKEKVWLTAQDDDVSEECADNEDEGPIPLDDDFPSGDDAPPAHPNCRCTIAPYVDFGSDSDEEEE